MSTVSPSLQPSAREERVVGGDEHLGNATRIDQVDVVRNAHHLGRADGHELGVATALDEEHDAVAWRRAR